MTQNTRVLVVGATGYLGTYIISELKRRGYWVRALSRDRVKAGTIRGLADEVFFGDVTRPATLDGLCTGIDTVISALGITRQRDGVSYLDVDYQGNLNILTDALAARARRFMYISALNADERRNIQVFAAKERFVDALKVAPIKHIVIRPAGFFSGLTEMFRMAQRGCIYLFDNGECRTNPIHGADLAQVCAEHLEAIGSEIAVGGPEVLSYNDIARLAFAALGRPPRIVHVPSWFAHATLAGARRVASPQTYGPLECFVSALTSDMVAPAYGRHTVSAYFEALRQQHDIRVASAGPA